MLLSRVSDWRARSVDMPSLDNHSQENLGSTARLNTNMRPLLAQPHPCVLAPLARVPLASRRGRKLLGTTNHRAVQLRLPLDRFLVDGTVLVSRLIHRGDFWHHVVQTVPDTERVQR